MNSTVIHRLLDFFGLLFGAMVVYDWTSLGFNPAMAATIAAYVFLIDKILKLAINLTVDGPGGLFAKWDTNTAHNVVNVIGLFIASMLAFDWSGLGLSPQAAATMAGAFLFADKAVKFWLNINRAGWSGILVPPDRTRR